MRKLSLFAYLASALLAMNAEATLQLYTDLNTIIIPPGVTTAQTGRAGFVGAITNVHEEGFNTAFSRDTQLVFSDFTVTTNKDLFFFTNAALEGGAGLAKSGIFTTDIFDEITFAFNQPITSFGVDISDFGDFDGEKLYVNIGSGDLLIAERVNSVLPNFFVGIVSDTPFHSITFKNSSWRDAIVYDFAQYSPLQTPVPEPSTFVLTSLGIAVAMTFRGLRRNSATR